MKTKVQLNIPNILTFVRLIMVPFAVCCALNGHHVAGFVIYLSACATDVLDGYIARKFNLVTDAGKLLDPLADKVMIMAMVVTFFIMGLYPLYMLIIILVKELLMVIGAAVLLRREVVVQANWPGKLAALLTHVSIGLAFLSFFYKQTYYYVMIVAIVATILSLIQYIYLYFVKGQNDSSEAHNPKTD